MTNDALHVILYPITVKSFSCKEPFFVLSDCGLMF